MFNHLDYRVTLTRPDGSVVKTLTVPVLQESADAEGNASSRLDFGIEDFNGTVHAERQFRSDLKGLENAACQDANERAIATAREAGILERAVAEVGPEVMAKAERNFDEVMDRNLA